MSKLTKLVRSIKENSGSAELNRAIIKRMREEKASWGPSKPGRFSPSGGFDARLAEGINPDIKAIGDACGISAFAKYIGAETDKQEGDSDSWELAKVGSFLHDLYQGILSDAGLLTDVEAWVNPWEDVWGKIDGKFMGIFLILFCSSKCSA